MSETCPKCHRRKRPDGPADGPFGWEVCYGPTTHSCLIVTAARHAGMREGLAIAKEHAASARDASGLIDETGRIDWTDADAELERRMGGKERGDG